VPRLPLILALLAPWTIAGCGSDGLDAERAAAESCRALHLQAAPARASLVLIVNDTMRRDRVGAYGGPARTPVFDAFAGENLLFRRASTPAPWTKPAVASLFTALYPSQHGVRDDPRLPARNGEAGRVRSADVLGTPLVTLAEVLRDAGFRTAAFVSNPWMGRPFGFDQGFERYEDGFARFDAPGEVVSRAGLDWLAGLGSDERFFLYLHYVDAHQPYGRLSVAEVLSQRERLEADRRALFPEARATRACCSRPQRVRAER
jgi:arylsulfatase A-like enzyme